MAYDGIFIKKQISEISIQILNERIYKITQDSYKSINILIHKNNKNIILTINVDPNFPHIILTNEQNNSLTSSFLLLLKKHLTGGIIKNITQINCDKTGHIINENCLERIIDIEIKNIDVVGETNIFHIIIELMGKYSNIILANESYIILDTINKNSNNNRLKINEKYNLQTIMKQEFLHINSDDFIKSIINYNTICNINSNKFSLQNAIMETYAGISKNIIKDFFTNNDIANTVNYITNNIENSYETIFDNLKILYDFLKQKIEYLCSDKYKINPYINFKMEKPQDFYFIKLNYFYDAKAYDNINDCLQDFINLKYKNISESSDKQQIEKNIKNIYSNLINKQSIYENDLKQCENYLLYKKYADLLSAYGYNIKNENKQYLICDDYTDNNKKIEIPINKDLSTIENINFYYNKYNKQKRTIENVNTLIIENNEKIEHLKQILSTLNFSNKNQDLFFIKEELAKYFKTNIKEKLPKAKQKKEKINYNIHHFISSNGIDIYVGKNNIQNEYLTFTFANKFDTWFHIKNATGAHVIVKKNISEIDEKTLVEAATLAAFFSEKSNEAKATVDYTVCKELKKVKGKPPGFCIYHTNKSINVIPSLLLKEIITQ